MKCPVHFGSRRRSLIILTIGKISTFTRWGWYSRPYCKIGSRKKQGAKKRDCLHCRCIAFAVMREFPLLSCHLEAQLALSLSNDIIQL